MSITKHMTNYKIVNHVFIKKSLSIKIIGNFGIILFPFPLIKPILSWSHYLQGNL